MKAEFHDYWFIVTRIFYCLFISFAFSVVIITFGVFVINTINDGPKDFLPFNTYFVYICEKNGFPTDTFEEQNLCSEQHFLGEIEKIWCTSRGYAIDTPFERSLCDTTVLKRDLKEIVSEHYPHHITT